MDQRATVAGGLWPRSPAVADLLTAAEPDLPARFAFPGPHRRQIRSTNAPGRADRETRRRTAAVGVLPRPGSPVRPAGTVLVEQDDGWQDGRRRFSPESTIRPGAPRPRPVEWWALGDPS